MKEIDELVERLDSDSNVDGIRLDIADLIAKSLAQKREAFGYWEKAHLAHAIAVLAHNVHAGHRDSTSWLRLCLVSIESAYIPADKRSEDYTARNKQIDALTFDQLVDDIRKLGGHD
ncbi:hypothetical protein [Rhodoferax sp. UBA5149]|uniref:hypothetical protein n=1 Tax=Rhodoferax sp. UBA5149 TaxID=1947379 RepID=UPI0025D33266|nr:hypothetical protein [Rhodoferax sp. UBA5149]